MFQDKYGKIATEFNTRYHIIANPPHIRFEDSLLNYKYNSLIPQFQDQLLQDIRAATLTAQKGYLSSRILKNFFRELPNHPEYYNQLVPLYKESLKPQTQNIFYFSGMGSGIKVEKVNWPFTEGFGFCIWVQVENINHEQFNETNLGTQKIISVHGQGPQGGGGIECYIMRGSVYYRTIPTIYQEAQMGNGAVFIGQLKNGFNFIGISHETAKKFSSSHLTFFFNNEPPKTMTLEYPKIPSNAALTRFTICENLFGTASCILLMNQSSSKIKTIQQVYGHLAMDLKQLQTLQTCLEKQYFDRIMSIYIPEFADGQHVIDVMGKNHALLQYKSGYVTADKNKFHQFGGFRLFYVMLHLSGTQYKQVQQAQLNLSIMFEILNTVLKNNPSLQNEAFCCNFFPTIASIIVCFEKPIINTKCVELLNETKQILTDNRLLDHFFFYILWNSKIHQQCSSEQVFQKLLQLSSQLYLQNPQHFMHFVSSKDILDMLIFSYQENSCCDQHCQEGEQSFQLQFFERILYLFNQQNDITEHLILFDQYFISKISPCLLLQILTILKSLLVDNEDQAIRTDYILQTWNQNNIVKQLLFLFKTTPYYDIRAMLIYFLNLIFQQQFPNYKIMTLEAIEFITNSIEPLQELTKEKPQIKQNQQQPPPPPPQPQQPQEFDELKNMGIQFLNNDYESVPQAPSMTNRRKPNQGFFDSKQRPAPRAQSIPAPEIEVEKKASFSVDQRGKKKFHIKIDTDAINALYNYGGEQGKKNGFDHEAFNQELIEIHRLAKACHMYMQGHREKEEPYIESPRQLIQQPQQQQQIQNVVKQPPMSTKNSQAPKLQFQQQELNSIKEVSSSSMSIVEPKKKIQSFTSIYNQLMGWMLDKLKIGANEALMIEEGDQIRNPGLINAIMKIFNYSNDENLKAQILQDLLCLAKSHPSNSILMLGQQSFQSELLKSLSQQEEQSLILEIGSRLHSTLIVHVMKSEYIGADYVYDLLKDTSRLVNSQLSVICEQLFDQCKNYQPSCESQIWKNTMHMGLYFIEMRDAKLLQKIYKIIDLIYKDYQIIGTATEQIIQISNFYSEPMQQLISRTQNFFNLKIQNYQVFEILLEMSDQNSLPKLLLTYSITNEINRSEISYGLVQIIGKMILKGGEQLTQSITQMLYIIKASIDRNHPSFLRSFFNELSDDFDIFMESLLAKSFADEQMIHQFVEKIAQNNKLKYDFADIHVNIPQGWAMESLVQLSKITREIQQFGEAKFIEIDERKTQWLYLESEKERIGRNRYHKGLNLLFTNDGWLSSGDFYKYSQRNALMKDFSERLPENKLFGLKISKLLTTHFSRPYIKIKPAIPSNLQLRPITTPQTAPLLITSEYDKFEQGQKPSTTSQAVQAATQLFNIGKNIGNNIKNTIKTMTKQSPEPRSFQENTFKGKRVMVIDGLHIYPALFSLTGTQLMIQYEHLIVDQTHVSLAKFQLPDHKRLVKYWPVANLVLVVKKKYLQKRNALEIFFIDGKSLFISILDQGDLDEVAQKLLRFRKTPQAPHFIQSKTTDPVKLLEKQGYLQKWHKQQMSNFKYLLTINNLASRSYNDLTQYPVFPWVICESKDQPVEQDFNSALRIYPEGQFRAMQKTMGALGNNTRIKSYIERFEQSEQGGEIPAFHYGSHYSSPAITSQYLIRLEPFTTAAREIQGGKFDISDRLFYSFLESYRCATEDVADVRELIPEIFCLPEMFLNLHSLDFGKTQSGMSVNNVILPKWAGGNPWKFVAGQRNALESEEIQKNLPEWIDLIFGFKQRGKEAEKSLNKFFYVTYDNAITWERMEENKLSIETQIVNFGITPLQIFVKAHIGRIIDNENQFISQSQELKVYRPPNKKKVPNTMKDIIDIQQASNRAIIKIKWVSDVRLLCLRKEGKIDYLKWTSQNDVQPNQPPFQCGLEREKAYNFEKPLGETYCIWDISAQLSSYPIVILNQGKLFVCGGYHLGKLLIIGDNNQLVEKIQTHTSTVTAIATDKKESVLITGDKSGHVIVWHIDKIRDYKLVARHKYFDHSTQINCIYVSNNMKLFATACAGGLVYTYNLYNGQLFRSFQHPNRNPINSVLLSSRPLYCLVFFSANDRTIYSYSINGFLLEIQQEACSSLIDCQIIRNNLFQDVMVYGTETGELVRRALPYLQQFKRFLISAKSPVLAISHSKDKKFLICGCNDGEISVMAQPQK